MTSMEGKISSMESDMAHMSRRIDVIDFKLDRTNKKVDDLQLDMKLSERNIKRDISRLQDQMDTVVEVLKQHELIAD